MATPTAPTKNNKTDNKNAAPPPGGGQTTAMTQPPETTAMAEFDYGDDAGQGFENQDMSDRKLPIIECLQSNSPKVTESRGKIFAGQFHNTVTNEIYDEVYMVPCITDHVWLLWVPRDDGGGFRGRQLKNSKMVVDAIARNDGKAIGKLPVPQSPDPKTGKPQPTLELIENFEIYVILYDAKTDEMLGFAMVPFASTKIKVYKAWNSAVANFAPTIGGKKLAPGKIPLFAHRVKMTSETETKGGNTYFVPVLTPALGGDDLKGSLLPKAHPLYAAGKQLHDDVKAGLATANYETQTQEQGNDPEAGVPF